MWGQVTEWQRATRVRRIIPTRVGTSYHHRPHQDKLEDHPHACGDKYHNMRYTHSREGSSPRVWGQERKSVDMKIKHRIIPTRVGTSSKSPFGGFGYWDHPHACGDKKLSDQMYLDSLGSSPRVWGQVRGFRDLPLNVRIIPTRVGTRKELVKDEELIRDHPHACGDKLSIR